MTEIHHIEVSQNEEGILYGPIVTYEFEEDFSLLRKLKTAPNKVLLFSSENGHVVITSLSKEILLGYRMGAEFYSELLSYGIQDVIQKMKEKAPEALL